MDLSWIIPAIVFTVVLVIGLSIAAALAATGAKRWAWGAGLTAPFMVYALPMPGFVLSLNLLSGLAAVKGASVKALWDFWWFRFAALMTAIQLAAMAWSPTPIAGFRDFVYALPFFFLIGALYQFDDKDGKSARRLLAWALVLCNIEALLVYVFRISPPLEAKFITSRIAGFFIPPNVLYGLFTGAGNNIFDPGKSGGFFVNGNTASAFLGCVVMLSWFLGKAEGWRSLTFTAIFCWVAVFFTGSKAGAMCAVGIPFLLLGVKTVRTQQVRMGAVVLVCFLAAALIAIMPLVWSLYEDTGFTRASSETLNVRQKIWGFAWSMFRKHPLIGLGHGGWEEKYPLFAFSQGINPGFPPHNFLLILWTKAGIFAALAGFGYFASFLVWGVRAARHATADRAALATGLTTAFLWEAIQASAENFGLIGEPHITTLLAIAMGIVARECSASPNAKAG